MLKKFLLIFLSVFTLSFIFPGNTHAVYTLSGSDSLNHLVGSTLSVTDLQISGTGTEPIPVKLRVTSGVLSLGTTTGLTFTGSSSGSTLYFKGTLTNLNNALSSLKYSRSGSGSDTLEVSLVEYGEVFFSENSHLYKFITVSGGITANNAVNHATNQTAYGATGYLATITSQAENDFVAARLQGDGWIGASDAAAEGNWKWITGPESGTQFWSGVANGSPVSSRYSNWASGEPNDYNTGEDCAQFYITSSKWNDLPCTGSTLTGYVVEFGNTGDMPTVVAKNINLTTRAIYTLNYSSGSHGTISGTLSQSVASGDSGTGVTAVPSTGYHFVSWSDGVTTTSRTDSNVSRNISVTASFAINTYTVSYSASSHGAITGNSSQTINHGSDSQSVTAQADTGYHFTSWSDGVTTASRTDYNVSQNISVTASFMSNDTTAPLVSSVGSSSVSTNQIYISWVTDENASSQVQYGLVKSYGFSSAESDTSTRVINHTVVISDLKPCARYFYRVISRDTQNNTTASDQQSFFTQGCIVSNVIGGGETSVPLTGGSLELVNNRSTVQLSVPDSYADETADFQINKLNTSSAPTPPSGKSIAADNFYELLAVTQSNEQLTIFDNPVTFTITYDQETENNFNESSLDIYKFDGTDWIRKNCLLDTSANTLTCSLSGFSTYALLGDSKNTQNNSQNPASNNTESPQCSGIKPSSSPDLFQANTTKDSVTLFFTPINNTSDFVLAYSTNPNAEEFGSQFTLAREGVQNFTINLLKPNTVYYVKIRGQIGCMSGDWSNILKIKTDSKIYYKNSSVKNINSPIRSKNPDNKIITITPTPEVIQPSPSVSPAESPNKPSAAPKQCLLWWCW